MYDFNCENDSALPIAFLNSAKVQHTGMINESITVPLGAINFESVSLRGAALFTMSLAKRAGLLTPTVSLMAHYY